MSWLAGLAVALKRTAYRRGWKRAYVAPVPVIVVGNIYVGGTGKTPLLVAIVEQLRQRGWHPGVVSRGYGVEVGAQPRVGQGTLDAAGFGDEPALIGRRTGAPIAVHPRRAEAAQALLAAHPEVDVIVSDDGLQHLALARDVEIVVQDQRGVGNGRLLPAGPLREPARRLADVDAVVTNIGSGLPVQAASVSGGPRAVQMQVAGSHAIHLRDDTTAPLSSFADQAKVAAVAGIGRPARFFDMLRSRGITLSSTLALPDHYDYASSPFTALDAASILVTEKDAVKCARFDDPRVWSVAVSATLSDPEFFDWLEARLHGRSLA